MSEAIRVGRDMGAKFTVLTHFSLRYRTTPVFPRKMPVNVAVAFDLMRVWITIFVLIRANAAISAHSFHFRKFCTFPQLAGLSYLYFRPVEHINIIIAVIKIYSVMIKHCLGLQ